MPAETLMLAFLRGLHLTALLLAFGTLLFAEVVAPSGLRDRLRRHARVAAFATLVTGLGWLGAQAKVFAGTWDLGNAILTTLRFSRFGHVLGLRLLLILPLLGWVSGPGPRRWLAPGLAGAALSLQGALGHAGAAEGGEAIGLITSEALHLLAAGAWLGALPPLLLCVRTLPPHEARMAAERFSPIGLTAVLVITATAFAQAFVLVGSLPAIVGTGYGRAALLKLVLFVLMLVLAVWNRLSLTDRLDAADPTRARRLLTWSVAIETGCGLLVILTAGFLASLVPGAHDQIVWPFARRPGLDVLGDPDLSGDVAFALLAIGTACAMVAISWIWRRYRLLALAASVALIVWKADGLRLLLVDAYPTTYQTAPSGFSAASIRHGHAVFEATCTACHGPGGQGNGPTGAKLRIKPADLTAGHVWDHLDGELFWWISRGIEDPEGGLAMPGFNGNLSDDDRWAVINYVRALNSGAAMQLSGTWTHPIPAPDFPIACTRDKADRLSELRGRFVRIVTTDTNVPTMDGMAIVRLDRVTDRPPPANGCASASADAWDAYAVVTGLAPSALAGWEFLVDPAGWLRVAHGGDSGPNWNDPAVIGAELRELRAQPMTGSFGGVHVHEH